MSSPRPNITGQRAGPDVAAGDAAQSRSASTELPTERSRFSRWLAKFGLGELTAPLLRPAKRSEPGSMV